MRLTRGLLVYIEKLEEENIEKQNQLEVFLKFEEEFEELKEKFENQSNEFKTLKIEKIKFESEIKDLNRNIELKTLRMEALQKRVENEQTGRVRLEEKQEKEAFQEEEYKQQIKTMERQLLTQNEEM